LEFAAESWKTPGNRENRGFQAANGSLKNPRINPEKSKFDANISFVSDFSLKHL